MNNNTLSLSLKETTFKISSLHLRKIILQFQQISKYFTIIHIQIYLKLNKLELNNSQDFSSPFSPFLSDFYPMQDIIVRSKGKGRILMETVRKWEW